jgi:DNA primase
MAFTPQFLDEIRARVPLAGIVGKRVRLERRGREYIGLCPFHNEKTPSFSVVEDKGFYHCFGCGAHGDVIGFVMRTEGLGFPEAVEKLAGEAGLPMPTTSREERERFDARGGLLKVLDAACGWYERMLRQPEGRAALGYLKGRGLTDETIARFRLGYAPDRRDALKAALIKQGYDESLLLAAGLLGKPDDGRATYDFLRGRVTFPIADQRGRIIAFGGRTMGEGGPKYLNSRDSDLFHKGRALYAHALAREAARGTGPGAAEAQELIVAEGYMDVIALHQAGFAGAVAPLGTALTESQLELLWRMAPEPYLCFDGDAAGRRAAARAAERALPLLEPGRSLRFVLLPAGEDPDSLIRAQGPQAFRDALAGARPLIDVVWEMARAGKPTDTPERRALIRKELRDLAARIAERSVQEAYLAEIETRLAAAFGGRRQAAWKARGGPGGQRGKGKGRGGWPPEAVSVVESDGNVRVLALRRQQALLAAIVNHPWLVGELGEEIGTLRLDAADLDRLRQEIIKVWSPDLDSGDLQRHLCEHGFADLLTRVLSGEIYELCPFARSGADKEAVRQGWTHVYEVFEHRQSQGSEIEGARQALDDHPSKRNWAYLEAVKSRSGAADDDLNGPRGD